MKRVLIVEDDPNIAGLQKDYLEKSGYEVDVRFDGESGFNAAFAKEYDMIILDVMLPKMDGVEVAGKIRQVKDVPIMMISARDNEYDKIEALSSGADDYMTKPFSFAEMAARVKAQILKYDRLTNKVFNDVIKIKNVVIEKTSRRVYVNEEEKSFTNMEFELLLFLATNPNKIWNKKELFSIVWGMDSFGDVSTVTVHMKKIREKIETGEEKLIETIWGVGYRLNT